MQRVLTARWMRAAAILVAPGFAVGCNCTPLGEASPAPNQTQTEPSADARPGRDEPIALIDLSHALRRLSEDNPRSAPEAARQDGADAGVAVARERHLPDVTSPAGYGVRRIENRLAYDRLLAAYRLVTATGRLRPDMFE